MIPVEGHKHLYRDENSGAIVNCDTLAYTQYIKMKSDRRQQRDDIDKLKNDIEEIKSLLKEIINGSK
jgi:hypothetical protein